MNGSAANPTLGSVDPGFFESTINKIEELLRKIQNKINELFATINRTLSSVPDWLVADGITDQIQRDLKKFNAVVREFFSKINDILAQTGSPATLVAAGEAWIRRVGTPAGAVAAKMSANYMKVDDFWEGEAVEQYRAALDAQHNAFAEAAEMTTTINDSLNKSAGGIQSFWTGASIALGAFLAGIAGAVLQAAGIVTIPGAIVWAIGAAVIVIGALGTGTTLMLANLNAAADAARTMRDEKATSSSFPDGHWPKVTTVDTSEFRPD